MPGIVISPEILRRRLERSPSGQRNNATDGSPDSARRRLERSPSGNRINNKSSCQRHFSQSPPRSPSPPLYSSPFLSPSSSPLPSPSSSPLVSSSVPQLARFRRSRGSRGDSLELDILSSFGDIVELSKTKEKLDETVTVNMAKFSIKSSDPKKIQLLSHISCCVEGKDPVLVEDGDRLCLVPVWRSLHNDLKLQESLDEQPQAMTRTRARARALSSDIRPNYGNDCCKKILDPSYSQFFIDLDPENHRSLLSICCEYKKKTKSQENKFDFFKTSPVFKTIIKVERHWFIELWENEEEP